MLKVLLVDDEKKIADGLSLIIDWEKYGFEICARARNGQEGIAAAKQWEPDLIVTDIRMPIMDGLEMIRQLEKIQPHVQYIILSGYSEFQYAKKAMQLGVKHYVLKPIEEEEFESCLAQAAHDIQADKEEETVLDRLRTHSMAYMKLQKENMLRDWMYAGEQAEDIVAVLADLNLVFPYGIVLGMALEKKDRSAWSAQEMDGSVSMLEEVLPFPSISYAFRYNDHQLGILSNLNNPLPDHGGTGWLNTFHQRLSGECGVDACIGTGPAVCGLADLNSSFQAALKELCSMISDSRASVVPGSAQPDPANAPHHSIVDEIKAYLDSHYSEELTLASVAERFFIHPHYLSPLFRKKTGETFLTYLTRVRMERAKQLLRQTHLKVYQICSEVGYEDSKYFSKIFERTVGMKPNEYKHGK